MESRFGAASVLLTTVDRVADLGDALYAKVTAAPAPAEVS
jgi:hypothetical protein